MLLVEQTDSAHTFPAARTKGCLAERVPISSLLHFGVVGESLELAPCTKVIKRERER